MAAAFFLLLIAGSARLSYIEATAVKSPHLRGEDSYNRLPRTNNTSQNRGVIVDEARSAEWSQHKNASVLTPISSCGEGDSFTVSSRKHGDLAGCYIKVALYNGEAIYTSKNRMGKKNMVSAINFNKTNGSPDVHWTLARTDSLLPYIFCISLDFDYHTHPVDASWICDFSSSAMFPSPRSTVPLAANRNDIAFSCGCTTVMRGSRVKTKHYRPKTNDGAEIRNAIVFILLFSACIAMLCNQLGREQARSRTGSQCSSSTETARNAQAAAVTSSNEPASGIEMMHLLRRPGGAVFNPGDFLVVEEENLLEVPQ